MESYNFLMLPILGAIIIGVIGGLRGKRGAAWTLLNAVVSVFVACLVIAAIFLFFLMGPMASPGLAAWLSANAWVNNAGMAGLLLLPLLAAWLVVRLLRRIDAR